MRSKFIPRVLWFLIRLWHYPYHKREILKPETFIKWSRIEKEWHLNYSYGFAIHHKNYLMLPRLVVIHTKNALSRFFWWAIWHAGVGCAGGEYQPITGHLRTRICDWMQYKARSYDEE